MTEESEHYTGTTKLHKSLVTSMDPEPVRKCKHIWRPSLLRAILEVYFAIALHIARILLAPGPRWWPCGEQLHDAARSRAHFVPDYVMQIRACSSAWATSLRWASHAHQGLAASPWASTASRPNSPWFLAEARYKEWVSCLHFARVLLAPSFYKLYILWSGGRTHAHGMASILPWGFIAQQGLVLASLSLMALFIAQDKTLVAS
jgi:hypothetical protein